MGKFSLAEYNFQAKVFWCLMLILSLAFFGSAVFEIFSFGASKWIALAVALIISALLNQHQLTLPRTKIKLSAKEFIVFLGIIWLGVSGGVLLAAGVCAATYKIAPRDKKDWLLDGFISIVAAFAAGSVFYIFLQEAAGFSDRPIAETHLAAGWLILAAMLMTITHYLVSMLLGSAFSRLENEAAEILEVPKEKFIFSAVNPLFSFAAALILHFALIAFGLFFGFVLLLVVVVGDAAYRIFVARLAQKTKEISESSRIHLATVEALATAIDARDQVGIGHVRRTQIYAVGIGEILGLSESDLHALNTGALLHDIGKLAVPDHILNKHGRLTPAELEKTKIHASVGASILEKVPFNCPVVPTVKYHHEMWDGSGYPEGLKGEKIPLTARILSVADAYDTLRGARPYRPAVSRDDARRFLLSGAGKQFDPNVVNVFLRSLRKFEAEVEAQGFSYTLDDKAAPDLHSTLEECDNQSYVEQIKRANREVFTLYELARVFSASLNLQDTLSLFVQKISELVPFDTCVVYLLDETGGSAKAAYISGENEAALKGKEIKSGVGATGFVLSKRQPVHKIEPGLDFTYNQFDIGQDYSAMASLPLLADEKLIGAVSLYSYEMEDYQEEHMRLLETVSRIGSDAICVALQHAESESRALTDPMTGLPNARSLQMQYEKETARAARNGSTFQVMMLDLDGFKAVNDTFGHKAGDKLLKELARIMNEQLRDYDFLARYAGDEFVIIVPETETEAINELAHRIEQAVTNFVLPVGEGKSARVGISIGAACYPNHGETLDQIIVAADKAMYAVKATRKTRDITMPLPPINEVISRQDSAEENFIVELDESHIVSSAIN